MDILSTYGVNLDTATIYISGEIDASINIHLRMKLDLIVYYYMSLNIDLKDIQIILSSPGGDAMAIFALYDLFDFYLKQYGIKTNVHVEGICYSAATFLIGCATGKRTASKNSRFMVHELQIRDQGVTGTFTQTKSFGKELSFLQEDLFKKYALMELRGKKVPKNELDKKIREWEQRCVLETYGSSVEALGWGLIDEII
jgi:ATP-dependent protease ClpP protease subunit